MQKFYHLGLLLANINSICYLQKSVKIFHFHEILLSYKSGSKCALKSGYRKNSYMAKNQDVISGNFSCLLYIFERFKKNLFNIQKWTFKVMCKVYYRVKRDKKEAT